MSSTRTLQDVFDHLKQSLTPDLLCELISKLNAIRIEFTGDGAGLSGGIVSDKFSVAFLSLHVPHFKEFHSGESDCSVLGHPLSLKKINGKSTIALDWSKNPEDSLKRQRFETDILILNLQTEHWWKNAPKDATAEERASKFFTSEIKAGIYLISHTYCKNHVCLKSNNKTDSLIESIPLYKMMKNSIEENLFIEFPPSTLQFNFDIMYAFRPNSSP